MTSIGFTNNNGDSDDDDEDDDEWGDEDYTLHILAANENIADVDINGNAGSGYYMHSITLVVEPPANKTDDTGK